MVQGISNSSHGGHHAEVRQRRPDTERLVDNVFNNLDTKNQGFLDKADLQAALRQIPGAAGNATTDDAVFQRLDSDADGKVTKAELSSTLQKAADQLAGQFDNLRLHGRHGHHGHGHHGRGRGDDDDHDRGGRSAGFTKDQLSAQLEGLGGSHGGRARMLGAVIDNFAQADANADGQVNFREIVGFFRGDRDAAPATTPASIPAPVDPVSTDPVAGVPPAAPPLAPTVTAPVAEVPASAPAPATTVTSTSATGAATAPTDTAPVMAATDPVTDAAATAPAASTVVAATASTAPADTTPAIDAAAATPATPPADLAAAERAVLQRIMQLISAYSVPGHAPNATSISASA